MNNGDFISGFILCEKSMEMSYLFQIRFAWLPLICVKQMVFIYIQKFFFFFKHQHLFTYFIYLYIIAPLIYTVLYILLCAIASPHLHEPKHFCGRHIAFIALITQIPL